VGKSLFETDGYQKSRNGRLLSNCFPGICPMFLMNKHGHSHEGGKSYCITDGWRNEVEDWPKYSSSYTFNSLPRTKFDGMYCNLGTGGNQ